jgi:hypothetical protein
MSVVRHVRIDVAPVARSVAGSYSVRIEVQGPSARYCREQLIPTSDFASLFDSFMSDAVESIREEIEGDATLQLGIPTL